MAWGLVSAPPALEAEAATAAEHAPVRLAMEAFGAEAQIEVRGMAEGPATRAVREALLEIHQVSVLLDPALDAEGGLGRLLQARGKSAVELDPRAHLFLSRGLQLCLWSANAYSPLGGEVYALWKQRDEKGVVPHPLDLRQAVASADCSALRVEVDGPPRAALAEGSTPAAEGMARGFAIDQAFEVLTQHGVTNAFVEIATVVRAIGDGPDGKGWLVAVPGFEGTRSPLDEIWLRDQSLAVVRAPEPPGKGFRPVDMRTGVPPQGMLQVVAVSGRAVDTQAVATTLFVLGLSSGQRLLGALDPKPSIFWLLGNGSGVPLESTYRWSELDRLRRRR